MEYADLKKRAGTECIRKNWQFFKNNHGKSVIVLCKTS